MEPTCFTPDRQQTGELFAGDSTDMIIVHTEELDCMDVVTVGPRQFRIERPSTKEEFLSRCPQVPKLLRLDQYKFYLATPV